DSGDTCLGPAGSLLLQSTRVVRPLAGRVEEQHGAHCVLLYIWLTLPLAAPLHRAAAMCTGSKTRGSCAKRMSRLSACIITYNEADRIEACVRSVRFCDEIVVVDSHSTDSTRAVAQALGARVIERDWPGYRSQKQFAVDSASSDWVLCLDADERVSSALRIEI